jgi:ClpP class serine protease
MGTAKPAPANPFKQFMDSLKATPCDEKGVKSAVTQILQDILASHAVASIYNVVIFYDDRSMARSDADRIYQAVTAFPTPKPILLTLYSDGGSISAGYLIGKLCREYADGRFVVSIPRRAKSAATLVCCAADELHMGSLSELGPIDPQINDSPALGLKYAIEHLADLVKRNPAAASMFADYLHKALKPIDIGYYERVAESAVQYAQQLLERHSAGLANGAKEIAEHLVYFYKDHGFVIEKDVAEKIFGSAMIKSNTDEYKLGNEVYETISLLATVAQSFGYGLYLVGSAASECELNKLRK